MLKCYLYNTKQEEDQLLDADKKRLIKILGLARRQGALRHIKLSSRQAKHK